jgi:hypothetical protein
MNLAGGDYLLFLLAHFGNILLGLKLRSVIRRHSEVDDNEVRSFTELI